MRQEHLDLFTTQTDNVLMLLNMQNGHTFLAHSWTLVFL